MFRNIQGPELLIILLIIVLLFGARKLPETARGLGRSLRIFKAETKGLTDDDTAQASAEAPSQPAPQPAAAPAPPREITSQASSTPPPPADPVNETARQSASSADERA